MIDIDVLLAYGAAYKNVSINEAIFNEGHACSFYYQLVSGRLRWVNTDNEGKECIHSIVEAGECFGEIEYTGMENQVVGFPFCTETALLRPTQGSREAWTSVP